MRIEGFAWMGVDKSGDGYIDCHLSGDFNREPERLRELRADRSPDSSVFVEAYDRGFQDAMLIRPDQVTDSTAIRTRSASSPRRRRTSRRRCSSAWGRCEPVPERFRPLIERGRRGSLARRTVAAPHAAERRRDESIRATTRPRRAGSTARSSTTRRSPS
jgi:hypothetical protein